MKKKNHWQKTPKKNQNKKNHSTIPSISFQWCSVGGQEMKGASENKSITHWKAADGCVSSLEIILIVFQDK